MTPATPEWASFLTPERYRLFWERVEARLATLDRPFTTDPEAAHWKFNDDLREFGVVNLAQLCNREPLDNWDAEIDNFVRAAIALDIENDIPKSKEDLLPLLRLRLYSPASIEGAPAVKVPLAEGLVLCLAVDLPDRVTILPRDQAITLGMSTEELFDLGMANVRSTVHPQRHDESVAPGVTLMAFGDESFFATTIALDLADWAGPETEYGYLVITPGRHEFVAMPIVSADSIDGLPMLVHAGRELFARGPGSLSPYVYWVRNRRWAWVEVEETEEGIGIAGPDAFIDEVLKPLME